MAERDLEWFDRRPPDDRWRAAQAALSSDPVFEALIRKVGPCTLRRRRDYFQVLVLSLFNQQLATKTAATLFNRFRDRFPDRRITPERVKNALSGGMSVDTLKWCGLSRQKQVYLRDLAEHFCDGRIPVRRFSKMEDETIIEHLTQVKGIGRWTAEMFLLFALNRPDVWPTLDLGLQVGAKQVLGLSERPRPSELAMIGERFRPHRTVATWYLWRWKAADINGDK
ncbi:MAG: DNA-3-methyladenine glycosylase family protein [Myxococcota bacterium]